MALGPMWRRPVRQQSPSGWIFGQLFFATFFFCKKKVEDIRYSYINGPDGPIALVKQSVAGTVIYYICKDHLGSITGIMNSAGTILEEYNYDPWGRRRNPTDWSYTSVSTPTYTQHGFTGHEHLDMFGLINMNGRVYDSEIARFLNPDPIIQDPYSLLNYNRYSYCLNNPLKYSDPDGYSYRSMKEEYDRNNYSERSTEFLGGNYPGGWEDYVSNMSQEFYTGVRTSYAMNTLLSSNYGGYWSSNSGTNYFNSNAEAFFNGAIYNDYFNSWGSSSEMASSFVNACSRYSQLRLSQSLTASNAGVGVDLENTTPWMDIAIKEISQTERIKDPNDPSKQIINPNVQGYFTDGGFSGDPYTTPWCAIFANYCLQNAGIKGTGSPSSQSFLSWGQEIYRPVFGSIAVYAGHVGFVVRTNGNNIYLLGGNQSNMVSISHYTTWSKENVKSYRYPSMYRPSQFVW